MIYQIVESWVYSVVQIAEDESKVSKWVAFKTTELLEMHILKFELTNQFGCHFVPQLKFLLSVTEMTTHEVKNPVAQDKTVCYSTFISYYV